MVHIHISRLKQPLHIQLGAGIQAHTVLLLIQAEFHQILACRTGILQLLDLLHQLLIFGTILFVSLLNFVPLVKVIAHLPGQLDADTLRRSVPEDDGVEYLGGLGQGPEHHRIGDGVQSSTVPQLFVQGQVPVTLSPCHAPVVSVNLPAGFIVVDPLLQERNQLLHSCEGQVSRLAEGQGQQGINHLLAQSQSLQPLLPLVICLIQAENGANLIQLGIGQVGDVVFLHRI